MGRFSARQWQNCATCQFWTGHRKVNAQHSAAETDPSTVGTCTLTGREGRKYATNSCIGWRRWQALVG